MPNRYARRALRLLAGAALLTGFGLAAQTAHAALPTYTVVYLTVNTTADDPTATCGTPGSPPATPPHISGPCSIRGAAAFSNSASSSAHYYVVNVSVPAHTYLINSALGPITFSNAYTKTHLMGAYEYSTILDGQNATRIIDNSSNLTIQQMTLQHGNGTNVGTAGSGGALYSSGGALALTDVLVQNNSAPGQDGGGLYVGDNTDHLTRVIVRYNEAQYGGGLYANSDASVFYQMTVNNNFACATFTAPSTCTGDGRGGGMYADIDGVVTGSSFSNNVAGSLSGLTGEGGGIYNDFEMYLVNGRLNNNVAGNAGGGYYGADSQYDSIQTSSFSYNQAGNQGGGLWIASILFSNTNTISNNTAGIAPTGGASPTPGNTGFGGGMYIYKSDNEEQFTGTTFISNQALTATSTPAGTCGGEGGGLYNADFASMSNSHFLYNIACDGGAIFNDASSYGYLSIHDSSINQNTARIQGGGIYSNYAGQPARIGIDSTGITSNTASDAGGLYDSNDPASYLESTGAVILGNNATTAGACRNIGDVPCT